MDKRRLQSQNRTTFSCRVSDKLVYAGVTAEMVRPRKRSAGLFTLAYTVLVSHKWSWSSATSPAM